MARHIWRYTTGIVLVLAIVHSTAWYVVTSRLENAMPSFLSAAAEHGWRVESLAPQRAGWPWAASLALPNVVATRSPGNAGLRWTAERVDLTIAPLSPTTLRIIPAGDQTVEFPPWAPVRLRAGFALLRVPLSDQVSSDQEPASLDIHDLALEGGAIDLRVKRVQAKIAALAATLTADSIEIRPPLPAPFDGPSVASIRATTNLSLGAGPASAWQSAGGRVQLPAFSVQWGPLMVAGDGTGQLDPQRQPEGRATLRVQGGAPLLDALSQAGVIAPAPASAARAVLGLLSLAAHGQPITLPVALANRTLTVAQFPLLRLPLIDWGVP